MPSQAITTNKDKKNFIHTMKVNAVQCVLNPIDFYCMVKNIKMILFCDPQNAGLECVNDDSFFGFIQLFHVLSLSQKKNIN